MDTTVKGIRDNIDFVQWCARRSGVALAMTPDFHNQHRLEQSRQINHAWSILVDVRVV